MKTFPFIQTFFGFVMFFGGLYFLLQILGNPNHDDSDPPEGHSGMRIYHDQLTGCDYLANALGSLTPRMWSDGKQVCR